MIAWCGCRTRTPRPSGGSPQFTGWCLDRHDLCVSKLIALREKDTNFVAALLAAGLVDPDVIRARLADVAPVHSPAAQRAESWLASWT